MRTSLTFMIKGKELFWTRFKWTGNKIQKSVIFAPADNTTQYFKPQLTVSNIKLFTQSFALKCRLAFYMRDYSSINEGLKYLVYCIFFTKSNNQTATYFTIRTGHHGNDTKPLN